MDHHLRTPGNQSFPFANCTANSPTASVPKTSPPSSASSPFSSPTESSDSPSSASSSRSPIFDLYDDDDDDDSGSETSESSAASTSTIIRPKNDVRHVVEQVTRSGSVEFTNAAQSAAPQLAKAPSIADTEGSASHPGIVFRSRVTFEDTTPELDWFRADCGTLEELTILSRKRFKRASIWNDDGRSWARHWIELFIKVHWPDHQDTVKYARETNWSDLESISQERRTKGVNSCRGILLSAGIVDDLAISLWETLVRHLAGKDPDSEDDGDTMHSVDTLRLGSLLISPLNPNVRPVSPGRRASYDNQMTGCHQKKALGAISEEDRVASVSDLSGMVDSLSVASTRKLNVLKDKESNTWGLGRRLRRSHVNRSLGRQRAISPTPPLPASRDETAQVDK